MELEFWFEFGSTYSYPVAMKIEKLAQERGISVVWQPFLLGPIFKDQGWSDSPFNVYPAKGKYMWRDLERICQADGLGFKRPSVFPRNGLKAARIACVHARELWMPEFVRRVYQANFQLDLDISISDVILDCLPLSDEESLRVMAAGNTDEAKHLLKENTSKAKALGIFGAPTFLVDGEMFWGGDRLGAALNWLDP